MLMDHTKKTTGCSKLSSKATGSEAPGAYMQVREEAERPRTPLVAFFSILLKALAENGTPNRHLPVTTINLHQIHESDEEINRMHLRPLNIAPDRQRQFTNERFDIAVSRAFLRLNESGNQLHIKAPPGYKRFPKDSSQCLRHAKHFGTALCIVNT